MKDAPIAMQDQEAGEQAAHLIALRVGLAAQAEELAVLEEGVDLGFFVSSNSSGNNQYTHAEIEFLRTNIMGLNPEKRQVTHPVRPENILFVHNLYDKGASPVYQAMEANPDRVPEGFAPQRKEYRQWNEAQKQQYIQPFLPPFPQNKAPAWTGHSR